MRDWTLDTFLASDVVGRRALNAVRQWAEEWEGEHPSRVFIYGAVGSGKTGLALGMCREWLEVAVPQGAEADILEFHNVRAHLAEQRARLSRGESVVVSSGGEA